MLAASVDRAIHPHHVWQAVLGRLELEMTGPNFSTWMEGTRAIDLVDGTLIVEARSAFACDWLNERMRPLIERATAQVAGHTVAVAFQPPRSELEPESPAPAVIGQFASAPGATPEPVRFIGTLNDAFTFDAYIETEGNLIARNACTDLIEDRGLAMTPLVVHGSPGVGKTHLLHAIARLAREHGWGVALLSAEQFTNRYLTAMRDRDASGFQEAVRGVRLFVLDDLQYLEGKAGTANELVHTIDAVVNAGGHVVVAGERHPSELNLPERLISRLSAGLVTCIEPFRADERRHYISLAATQHAIELPDWAVSRIASLEAASVRALRGAVNRALTLARYGRLTPERLDSDLVTAVITSTVPQQDAAPDRVLERVAKVFEVAVSDLVGRSRRREVSEARAVAAAALRERGLSLAETAEALGGRDRSTIRQLAERGKVIASTEPTARAALAN